MSATQISDVIGSSQYCAIADDALKDEDNVAWVMQLAPAIRQEWIECLYWIRWLDRLAEADQLTVGSCRFHTFYLSWKELLTHGHVRPESLDAQVLTQMGDRWGLLGNAAPDWVAIQAWDDYVEAIARYHGQPIQIETLAQYEVMLADLAGAFFQVLPFLSGSQRRLARFLGMVDQGYNHLRDLHEDSAQGICYFPQEILDRFDLQPSDILDMSCFDKPGYTALMEFWLDDYLPTLQRQSARLLIAEDLHPSWQRLRDWSVHRYSRIERVLRLCHFNYVEFERHYWRDVKRDLRLYLNDPIEANLSHWQQWYKATELSRFLKLSPATIASIRALQARSTQGSQAPSESPSWSQLRSPTVTASGKRFAYKP